MSKALLSGNEAIARGAYEAGVEVATGYPGTPSSEILQTIAAQYADSIYAEWSTNEKVAMDAAAGAAYSGRRTLVTTKQVGMNVLADALLYTVYTGTEAGLVVVTADDPGMFSSQNEQDNRWYGRLAKIPILEPSDSQEAKDFILEAVELSEAYDTPVLVRTTMRVSHSKSVVELGERVDRPSEVSPFVRNQKKYVCTAMWAKRRHPVVEQRIVDLAEFAESSPLNRIELRDRRLGIVASGVVATYVREVFPNASILKLGMIYPLPDRLIRGFAAEVDRLVVIEELDPFLEEQMRARGLDVEGKALFPPCDELLPDTLQRIGAAAGLLERSVKQVAEEAEDELPPRTPVLCAGCPHRSTYFWLAKMGIPVAGDIGCYNLGCLPPFNAQHTMGCMGASIGVLHGMSIANTPERGVATIGDSTFFHSGIPALANMVHNGGRGVTIIMDNGTTAMTGHQDHPGTDWSLHDKTAPRVPIAPLVRALGVEMVRTVDAFDMAAIRKTLDECLAYDDGPAVLIADGPCVQLTKPPLAPYAVDEETCIACGTCFSLGCPAIVKSDEIHEATGNSKASIDTMLCVGCDLCRQVCPVAAIRRPEEAIG
jgi:indolepyruvate ferredoxin oxidoreductase alpha subunit